MSLLDLAESDLALTLESSDDFGQALTITDPADNVGNVSGQSIDIGEVIDPDTGFPVEGRFRGVSLRISSLAAEGLGIPVGVESGKSWKVLDADAQTWAVYRSMPDRTLGFVSLIIKEVKA
jgi:hypothetical protein